MKQESAAGPVGESSRITSLDLVRGVAVLGILLMNAVHFKFGRVPYLNLSAGGSESWLDWAVGIGGEIFVDQKFMGLFSLLFGAGILLFIERAEAKGGRPVLLNLWRNALLLGIGILHGLLWEGDVLIVYAVSALFLIALRRLPGPWLIGIGAGVFALSIPVLLLMQAVTNATDVALSGVWTPSRGDDVDFAGLNGAVLGLSIMGYFLRGLGMILMGAGLYRLGFMQGDWSARTYRLVAGVGIGVGLPLAAAGALVTALGDYSRDVAFIGQVPNTLGTIPASLGYMSLIVLWNRGPDSALKQRFRAVGRMALTNYLTQTVLGVLVLTVILDAAPVNRAGILLFVLAVWSLQLWWSQAWMQRFRFGPAEWLWRVATYRRGQALRRA
ncbi:MAG: DUF418 domain-containing protein [Chloroflexota bacterium]|nr:DUF418 domain-containing protein [Chloroflexota bacterium]MDE2920889.1 DUF418 domain-containing protein [Chloroflexota bacterium]